MMEVRLILESSGQRRSLSLDEFAQSFLEAVQRIVRNEVEQLLKVRPALAREPNDSPSIRPLALSKTKAAQALGVSVRTIDYCIANHGIPVTRIGRRVLVPLNSLEAVLKRGVAEVRPSR
jgi:excisionase family DNA binding protein